MSRRILFGCYEVPGWGGASTVSYARFDRMQRDGLDVAFVNLLHEMDVEFLRYLRDDDFGNPRSLPRVHTCVVSDPLWQTHVPLVNLITSLAPDLLLAGGFIAARLMQLAAPHLPLVFLTSGCSQVKQLVGLDAIKDFQAFERQVARGVVYPVLDDEERQAVQTCDLIVTHSPHVRFAFKHFFYAHAGKIYANDITVGDLIYTEAARFQSCNRAFADRDIDVIFVASSWDRPEKNYPLLEQIVSRCDGLRVHIVGEIPRSRSGAHYHGSIKGREDLYTLLGRSKTLVCPSRFDAAPGVLFEASAMGCNVVASANCGNWQLCHTQLLASRCDRHTFMSRIEAAVSAPFRDNRELFGGGYADLVSTLTAF